MDREIIDKLFLELSQYTGAKTALELQLQAENETLKNKIEFLRKRYPEIDAMEQALKGETNDR